MISIALIEDNRLLREGIAVLLKRTPDFELVASLSSADTSVLNGMSPEVILLDMGLEDRDSLRFVETVRATFPQSHIIVMDLLPTYEDIREFVQAGVASFVRKDAALEDLVDTIRSVAQGRQEPLPPRSSTLFSEVARQAVAVGRPKVLDGVRMTQLERKVINLIAEGMENKEIAARLHVSAPTVKGHVRNIMEKLVLHTRLQITAYSEDPESAD